MGQWCPLMSAGAGRGERSAREPRRSPAAGPGFRRSPPALPIRVCSRSSSPETPPPRLVGVFSRDPLRGRRLRLPPGAPQEPPAGLYLITPPAGRRESWGEGLPGPAALHGTGLQRAPRSSGEGRLLGRAAFKSTRCAQYFWSNKTRPSYVRHPLGFSSCSESL